MDRRSSFISVKMPSYCPENFNVAIPKILSKSSFGICLPWQCCFATSIFVWMKRWQYVGRRRRREILASGRVSGVAMNTVNKCSIFEPKWLRQKKYQNYKTYFRLPFKSSACDNYSLCSENQLINICLLYICLIGVIICIRDGKI